MRFVFALLACLIGTSISTSQTLPAPDLSRPLTLQESIRIAMRHHPAMSIAAQSVRASQAGLQQARSSFYPQVTPEWNYQNTESRTTFSGFGSQQSQDESGETNLVVRQVLWNGGRRELGVAQARQSLEAGRQSEESTRQEIAIGVISAYYDLLRRQDLLKVAQANVERAQNTAEVTRAQAEVGTGARKDIYQAEAELANAKVNLIQARNQVNVTEAGLKNALGIVTTERIQVVPVDTNVPASPEKSPSMEEHVQTAMRNRPDLRQLTNSIEISRLNVRLAQISTRPELSSSFSFNRMLSPHQDRQQVLSAQATWPLYDGGNVRAAVEESRANLEISRQRYEQLRQNILLEVEQAYLSAQEGRERAEASRQAVDAARVNYDFAIASRAADVATIVEVISAQAALVTAETNYTQAIYDNLIAEAQLRKATGTIGTEG